MQGQKEKEEEKRSFAGLQLSVAESELLSYPVPERNDFAVPQSWLQTSGPSCWLCASAQVINLSELLFAHP